MPRRQNLDRLDRPPGSPERRFALTATWSGEAYNEVSNVLAGNRCETDLLLRHGVRSSLSTSSASMRRPVSMSS